MGRGFTGGRRKGVQKGARMSLYTHNENRLYGDHRDNQVANEKGGPPKEKKKHSTTGIGRTFGVGP